MLTVALFDFSGVPYQELHALLPKDEQKRLVHGKSEAYRRASGAGRALLFSLYRAIMGTDAPKVFSTRLGAPYFATSAARFSISHDDTLVAVAISPDGAEVGVDVQGLASLDRYSDERLRALKERFSLLSPPEDPPPCHILRATLSDSRFTFVSMPLCTRENNDRLRFLGDFTYTEALLKAKGTGFSDSKEKVRFAPEHRGGTVILKDEVFGTHVLSFCIKNK